MIKKLQKIEENEERINKLLESLEVQNDVLDRRLELIEEKLFDKKERVKIDRALKQLKKRKIIEQKAKKFLLNPIKGEILEDRDLIKAVVMALKKDLKKT
ncbi:MAG: hypothetical protein B6U68_04095 [Candidatus Aenigmarchaeota archaeon ex4484_14]|nr:MAG: hypothetical protein B6U68_04095 [Candidatus Aenigmarchaeota archaeon ex4484_14]